MTDTIVADVALFCRFAEFNLADTASALRSPSKWQREAQAMRLLLDAGWSHEAISGALRTLTTWGEKPAQLEVVEIAATPDECTAELEERCNAQAELIEDLKGEINADGADKELADELTREVERLKDAFNTCSRYAQLMDTLEIHGADRAIAEVLRDAGIHLQAGRNVHAEQLIVKTLAAVNRGEASRA